MFFRKQRAKRWTKKIISKNMQVTTPIDYKQYIHKTDKITFTALRSIPLFDKVCSKMLSFVDDPQFQILDMSSKIRITEKQVPRIYFMVQSIANKLGIDMPELYLELDREPNAYTWGYKKASITVNSGLLECFEDDEIYAVLAHECGHIACQHLLYQTIGDFILKGEKRGLRYIGLENTIIDDILTTPLKLAFFNWQRSSELSADRAAVICCGSAEPVIETMMRLSGGSVHFDSEVNKELFIAQAKDYQELMSDSKINKALEFWLTKNRSHPFLAIRAYEAQQFANSDEFKNIVK